MTQRHEAAADLTAVEYVLTLTVKRPVRYDNDETLDEMAAWRLSDTAKRELEREVLNALRKIEGDCDVEVMEVSRKAE